MFWTAETRCGSFEDDSLRGLSDQIAAYYAEDDSQICDIKELYFSDVWGARSTATEKGLSQFIDDCEKVNQQMIDENHQEAEGRRQNEADYNASVRVI